LYCLEKSRKEVGEVAAKYLFLSGSTEKLKGKRRGELETGKEDYKGYGL